ncbi:penicillin-insensitive murein endopeptidase [Aureimonas glaciei]|uniref:Penicillin-insensitive murein endopeptidase n=1 Tax=Aureimonas glaciei TaxID=1776957 RepID=A0A917D5V4_9HYPH|nr:penicillin-insensitive murein endopeptidase [Aureimonas glaciei]GGD04385.1 penicillin-insensitive murein endopeptidase [Aureimonas glaciei]
MKLAYVAAVLLGTGLACLPAAAQSVPAKQLFGAMERPAALPSESLGSYAKGCIAGAVALPADGPTWQAMRLSRNRRWGHPSLVAFLQDFSQRASAATGWPGLLVGDLSQPRGGPMASGHASHQIGLDVDIWAQPMPARRLSPEEREDFPFRSVLKRGSLHVDEGRWDDRYGEVIKLAAESRKVQRIFVHPGLKEKLCRIAGRDRAWLSKVRPMYGHDEHFHIRLFCQPGSTGCTPQAPVAEKDGCDELDYWFNVALKPAKPSAKPPKPRAPMTMAALPRACQTVLAAMDGGSRQVAPTAPTLAAMAPVGAASFPDLPTSVPIPAPRPLP